MFFSCLKKEKKFGKIDVTVCFRAFGANRRQNGEKKKAACTTIGFMYRLYISAKRQKNPIVTEGQSNIGKQIRELHYLSQEFAQWQP